MNPIQDPVSLPPEQLRRIWRTVTWAGLLGSVYYLLCITGAPRIKFLTELGATASDFGLIAGLGSFTIVFQIGGSILAQRLRRRKPAWMALLIANRLAFFGVLAAPLLFDESGAILVFIIATLFLHDLLTQIGLPLWLSWMADLVPRRVMNRHWASRQRFITAANIVVMILVAVSFHYFEVREQIVLGFIILALVGIVLGVGDILMFIRVPEPEQEAGQTATLRETLTQPLRDRQFRPYLYFIAYWQLSACFAAPFFGFFMIDFLHLNVFTVQLLGGAAAVGVASASRFWGLLCDTYGFRPTLQLLAATKSITPLAFILVPQDPRYGVPYLAAFMFFDGVMNAGLALATQGVLLKSTPRNNRPMYIAAANFFSVGIMAGIAPVIAGQLIDALNGVMNWQVGPYLFTGFHGVFAISILLRFGGFALASRINDDANVALSTMLRQVPSREWFRISRLIYRLSDSPKEDVRMVTARALGESRNPLAVSELTRALGDSSGAVREAAAVALGKIGSAEAAAPLAQSLADPNSKIQAAAAHALGEIGGVDSLRALLHNLQRQDEEALLSTVDSLEKIGHDAAILPLICVFHETTNPTVRDRVAEALRALSALETRDEVFSLLLTRRPVNQLDLK